MFNRIAMVITLSKREKDYFFIGTILLLISCSIYFQIRASKKYQDSLLMKNAISNEQKTAIENLKGSVIELDKKAISLSTKADSLQMSENRYKNNYYEINKKFKSSVSTYNESTSDAKWRALTEAINE